MLPYLVVFSFSLLFLQFSRHIKSRRVQTIIILIALTFPAILAGWRDFSIGTDTKTYISYWHIACHNWEWQNYWQSPSNAALEELYLAFSFLISKVTHSDQYFLFFTQLLILLPIVFASRKLRVNIVWVVFIYLAIFFNFSLNVTRQVIAVSFCLFSLSTLLQSKYRESVVWIAVAYGFHHSAILFAAFVILYYWLNNYPFGRKKKVVFLVSIGIVLFFTIFSSIGMHLIEESFGNEYASYGEGNKFGTKFPIALFGLSLFNSFVYYMMTKRKKQTGALYLFNYLVYLCPAICFLGLLSRFAVRIVYYPLFMIILIFPYLIKNYNASPKIKSIIIIAYTVYFILTTTPYKTCF